METRQTSVAAYDRLVDGGVLSQRRAEVYSAVYNNGPATGSEICEVLTGQSSAYGIGPRFTELRDMGLLREMGERKCKVTGQTVIVWDVTDRVDPLPLPKKTGKLSKYRALLDWMDAELSTDLFNLKLRLELNKRRGLIDG